MSNATIAHEAPLEILRESPSTLLALLRAAGATTHGAESVEPVDPDLTETLASTRRADYVALLRDAKGAPVASVVVEVQLAIDEEKRFTWPLYVALIRARRRLPVALLVIAPDRKVARWARRQPVVKDALTLAMHVIGPAEIERLLLREAAPLTSPLAVIAALCDLTQAKRERRRADRDSVGVRVFECSRR